jgi:phospholipase C
VTGDLTSTLDFASPEKEPVRLPSTVSFIPTELVRHPDYAVAAPASQQLPRQEHGVRPARALPYALHAHGRADAAGGSFHIDFGNTGQAAAVFQVRSGNVADAPRHYTVEPQRLLSDAWKAAPGTAAYDLSVHGPNGFLRSFKGSLPAEGSKLLVRASYDEGRVGITLSITNAGSRTVEVGIRDGYRGKGVEHTLKPGHSTSTYWPLERSHGWYDLLVTVEGDPAFEAHFAGHVESGEDSISDPAMGRVRLDD